MTAASGRRIARNSAAWFVSENIAKVVSLLITIAVARALGEVDFGIFSFALSFTALFGLLINWGFRTLLTWKIAKDRGRAGALVGSALAIQAVLSVAAFGLLVLLVRLIGADPGTARAVYIAAGAMIFQTLADTPEAAFQAFEKLAYNAAFKILRVLTRAAVVFPLLFLGYGLHAVLWAYLAVMAFNLVLVLLFFHAKVSRLSLGAGSREARGLFADGFFFALKSGFVLIYFKIDVTMLQLMSTSASVGLYSAAYALLEALLSLPIALTSALLPVAIVLAGERDRLRVLLERAGRFLLAATVPVVVGGIILSQPLMVLLFGQGYAAGSPALAVLLLTLVPLSVVYLLGILEIAFRLERKSIWVLAANCVVNILLNLVLIPIYDVVGAALATVLTELFYLAAYFRLVRPQLPGLAAWRWAAKPLVAGLVMAIPVYVLSDDFLAAPILAGAATYGAALWLVRGISREEIGFVRGLFFRRSAKP